MGAGLLAMVVNDDVGCLNARGAWAFIASKARSYRGTRFLVGAGLPAMVVNDDVGCLNARGVRVSIASKARSYRTAPIRL